VTSRIIVIVAATLAVAAASAAEPDDLAKDEKDFVTTAANLLGDCSGFYEFMSEVFADKPATSKQMHELANGARMSAAYLLSVEYAVSHEKPKAIGEFSHYPQGRGDTNKTRMQALLEQKDLDGIKAEQKRCLDAAPMQNDIVQKIRDNAVDR
jgi:hypothetical protein